MYNKDDGEHRDELFFTAPRRNINIFITGKTQNSWPNSQVSISQKPFFTGIYEQKPLFIGIYE